MFKRLTWSIAWLLLLSACQPDADFTLLDGSQHRLNEYRGRWLIVNYWADWCEPCRDELPLLARFAEKHADRVTVLAVPFEPLSRDELVRQVEKLGIRLPVVQHQPPPRLPFPTATSLPVTWLIGPDGQVTGPLLGPQTEVSLLQAIRTRDSAF